MVNMKPLTEALYAFAILSLLWIVCGVLLP